MGSIKYFAYLCLVCSGMRVVHTAGERLFTIAEDLRSPEGVLTSQTVRIMTQCSAACLKTSGCKSFNLASASLDGGRRCELVRTDQNSVPSIQAAQGWTLYTSKH